MGLWRRSDASWIGLGESSWLCRTLGFQSGLLTFQNLNKSSDVSHSIVGVPILTSTMKLRLCHSGSAPRYSSRFSALYLLPKEKRLHPMEN